MNKTQNYIISVQNKLNRHGLKLFDLAKHTGLTPGSFTQWKNGTNNIKAVNVERINQAVGEMIKPTVRQKEKIDGS